jgi:hypothetical protein
MKNFVFWDVTQCGTFKKMCYEGTYRLYLQGENNQQTGNSVSSNYQLQKGFLVRTDVMEERISSIFKVKIISELRTLTITSNCKIIWKNVVVDYCPLLSCNFSRDTEETFEEYDSEIRCPTNINVEFYHGENLLVSLDHSSYCGLSSNSNHLLSGSY